MEPFISQHFGNPSSKHWASRQAKEALEEARQEVATLLGARVEEIVFTSGGSESNNYAIKGLFQKRRHLGRHIITTAIEHPAVLNPCIYLELEEDADVTIVDVNRHGIVEVKDVERAIREDTILISVMHANNETGAVQPISEIGKLARERGITFHCDGAQSVGKIRVNVDELNVSLLSIAAHKFYGPKGVGALYIREGTTLEPLIHGAAHENGRRAGTSNVLLGVAMGAAAKLAADLSWTGRAKTLREKLWQGLKSQFKENISRNGLAEETLPNTLNCCIHERIGAQILATVPELAASTGSACHDGIVRLSPVLEAMGVTKEVGSGALRFSLGRGTNEDEIDEVLRLFRERI